MRQTGAPTRKVGAFFESWIGCKDGETKAADSNPRVTAVVKADAACGNTRTAGRARSILLGFDVLNGVYVVFLQVQGL